MHMAGHGNSAAKQHASMAHHAPNWSQGIQLNTNCMRTGREQNVLLVQYKVTVTVLHGRTFHIMNLQNR